MHFSTESFFVNLINRIMTACYMCLSFGALCHLSASSGDAAHATNITIAYWCLVWFVGAVGLGLNVPQCETTADRSSLWVRSG